MYFLYILQSKKRRTFYIGISTNLDKRLQQHNSGQTKSTKKYMPWSLIYSETYESKSTASKREWHLKHPVGYLEKRAIIKQYSKNSDGGFA